MRLSLLISVLVHVLALCALFFIFKAVPQMRLPSQVYNVKILQPIVRSIQSEPEQKPEVKPEKPAPSIKKPKKKTEKKAEKKPEVKQEARKEEKPMDVSISKDESSLTSVAVDGPRFPFSYYLSAIERRVSGNWFSAQAGQGEGYSCVVYFRLDRSGRVSDLRVEKSSGNSYFDRSAMRAIRSSGPFPPLPKAFTEAWLGIHFTFVQKD
jgi:TonB family protein